MQIVLKAAMYFLQLFTGAKVAYYRNVVASMTGNAAFPNPVVTMADFTTQIDLVETKANAVHAARTALLIAESELEQETATLDVMGRSLADYVSGASMGDPVVFETSGFTLKAPPVPVGVLPPPGNLRVEQGQTGTCKLRWSRSRGAKTWVAECAPEVTGPWTEIYKGTRSQCLATGLTSGTQYWFRVQAIGSAGPSDWSDPATKRAA
jgi:hypothetical protein